jgi:hypothetical protein
MSQVGVVVSPDAETKEQFGIQSLPAMIAVFPAPPSPRENSDHDQSASGSPMLSIAFYDKTMMGPPVFENLHRFLAQVVTSQATATHHNTEASTTSDANPASSVSLVETAAAFDMVCHGSSICLVGLFQDKDDEANDEHAIHSLLSNVAQLSLASSSLRTLPLVYLLLNGACQANVAAAFGLERWQLPTVVIYAPSKARYVPYVGVLEAPHVSAFVQSIVSGKMKTIPLSLPFSWQETCAADLHDEVEGLEGKSNHDDNDVDAEDMQAMMREILEDEAREKEARKRALQVEAEKAKQELDERATKIEAESKKKKAKKKMKKKKKKSKETVTRKDEL